MSTQNLLNLKIHKVAEEPTTYEDPTAIYLVPDNGHTHGDITNEGTLSTANYVVITDANKKITTSSNITTTELGYLNGVTSSIQTQLDGKAPTSHASSATTYGVASSSNYGHAKASSTTPRANGTATAGTETSSFARGDHVHPLQTSVTGSSGSCTGNAATATNVAWTGVTNKPTYYDAKAIKSITRSGTTFTYTCMDNTTGTFTQQDTNTTYSAGSGLSLSSTAFSVNSVNHLNTIDISSNSTGSIKAKTFIASSDKRLKENLIEYKSEKSILDLPVYRYNFINDETKKEHIGCLAQDLQEICPEVVNEDKDGYLAIEESKLVYLLLEEVKKLKKELDILKKNKC